MLLSLFYFFVKKLEPCEGLSVKKTVRWTVFSEERESGTVALATVGERIRCKAKPQQMSSPVVPTKGFNSNKTVKSFLFLCYQEVY